MADASTSDTATGPTTTYIYNEFGLPETGTIGAYGWLGGYLISGDALGGDLLMGARAYSTADGRFDQVNPVPGGSANPYDYAGQNPITNYDLAGLWGVRCYDYTCGYEFDNWRTNDIAYAAWIAWVASSSIAAAYVCKVLSTFGAGAICAAVIGVFVAVFSGGFHWVARCLYVGYGWGGWKHVCCGTDVTSGRPSRRQRGLAAGQWQLAMGWSSTRCRQTPRHGAGPREAGSL